MKENIKKVMAYLWQLPQDIIGAVILLIGKATGFIRDGKDGVYYWDFAGGLSLGHYVFIDGCRFNDEKLRGHEHGHQIQSLYLGWLYLLVIGIPSGIWALLYYIPAVHDRWSYFDFYTEKWADRLGGVTRK